MYAFISSSYKTVQIKKKMVALGGSIVNSRSKMAGITKKRYIDY